MLLIYPASVIPDNFMKNVYQLTDICTQFKKKQIIRKLSNLKFLT